MMQFVNILHIKKNLTITENEEKENFINQWKTSKMRIHHMDFFFVKTKKIINTPDVN